MPAAADGFDHDVVLPRAVAQHALNQRHRLLAGYSLEGRAIPAPSKARPGEHRVPVSPLAAAKLSLRDAMREQGVSNVALAERLGISEGAVRRLVDPDHLSKLDGVVAALAVLGHGIIIEEQKRVA